MITRPGIVVAGLFDPWSTVGCHEGLLYIYPCIFYELSTFYDSTFMLVTHGSKVLSSKTVHVWYWSINPMGKRTALCAFSSVRQRASACGLPCY
jgi:hypothetical protein